MSISKKAKANYAEVNRIAETLEPNFSTGYYSRWRKVNDIDFQLAANFVKYMWDKKSSYKMPKRIEFKKTSGHRYNRFKPRSISYSKPVDGFYKISAATYCINIERGWGHFAHEFSHDLAFVMTNNGRHGDFQSGVELEVHKELHTFLHKAKNNLIDITPLPVDEPKKRKRRKKRKTKKLPYQASYPTLLKRFPQIVVEDEGEWDEEDGRTVYYVYIEESWFEKHGLSSEHDCPLNSEGHNAWGVDERFWHTETLAKFIYETELTNKNN